MQFVIPTDEATFTELIEEINSSTTEADTGLDDCVGHYNSNKGDIAWYQKVLDWVMRRMREVGEKLSEAVEQFNAFLEEIGSYLSPGNPFSLRKKQEDWVEVKRLVTGSKTTVEASHLRADDSWKGDVGDGYGALIERQHLSIDTLAGYADSMATFLSNYASKILNAWIDFGERLLTYLIEQVDAVSEFISADPLEWLDIVPKIVNVCTNLAQLGVDLAGQLARNYNDSQQQAEELNLNMADLHGFPQGSWPAATIY